MDMAQDPSKSFQELHDRITALAKRVDDAVDTDNQHGRAINKYASEISTMSSRVDSLAARSSAHQRMVDSLLKDVRSLWQWRTELRQGKVDVPAATIRELANTGVTVREASVPDKGEALVEQIARLEKELDPGTNDPNWINVSRAEAIRQAKEFHAKMLEARDWFEKVKAALPEDISAGTVWDVVVKLVHERDRARKLADDHRRRLEGVREMLEGL